MTKVSNLYIGQEIICKAFDKEHRAIVTSFEKNEDGNIKGINIHLVDRQENAYVKRYHEEIHLIPKKPLLKVNVNLKNMDLVFKAEKKLRKINPDASRKLCANCFGCENREQILEFISEHFDIKQLSI